MKQVKIGMLRILVVFLLVIAAAVASITMQFWNPEPVELQQRYTRAESQFLQLDDVRIHYQDQGAGVPVILLHGHLGNLRMWDGWQKAIGDNYRFIRMDFPGYGLTSVDSSGRYDTARGIELVNKLAEHLGVERFFLVSTSFAGVVGFNYAAENPDRVLGLVLLNSGGLPRQPGKSPNQSKLNPLLAWLFSYYHPRAFYEKTLNMLAVNKAVVTDEFIDEYYSMNERRGRNREGQLRLSQYQTGDPQAVLAKITVPVLVQWGSGSPLLPTSEADQFQAWLVNSRTVKKIYPKAGHLLPIEEPVATARDADSFFQSILSGGESVEAAGSSTTLSK